MEFKIPVEWLERIERKIDARGKTLESRCRMIEKHSDELLRLGGGRGQDPSTSHWSVEEALLNHDKESQRRISMLEQIHEDLQFIIGELRRIQARMDYGFALIIARLDAEAAANRRFLRSLDAHERRLSKRQRHRIH